MNVIVGRGESLLLAYLFVLVPKIDINRFPELKSVVLFASRENTVVFVCNLSCLRILTARPCILDDRSRAFVNTIDCYRMKITCNLNYISMAFSHNRSIRWSIPRVARQCSHLRGPARACLS